MTLSDAMDRLGPLMLDALLAIDLNGTATTEDIHSFGSVMKVLEDRGLVSGDKAGRPTIYRLTDLGHEARRKLEGPVTLVENEAPVARIQRLTAEHFNIPVREMVSDRRSRYVARPRQVAMYFAKQLTPKSLPDIGRRFGGRDHTTVIHALRQVETLVGADPDFAIKVKTLERKLIAPVETIGGDKSATELTVAA